MDLIVALSETQGLVETVARWGSVVAETAGIAVILIGALVATIVCLRRVWHRSPFDVTFESYRRSLGRAILLGLEFLVAADIIGTVLVDPTFRNLGVLAVLVAVRTFLSFTLTVEVEGRWPWQRRAAAGSSAPDGGA